MKPTEELTENDVVTITVEWLEQHGFSCTEPPKLNRRKGDDIAVLGPDGTRLFVECKGAVSLAGNVLNDWGNAAMAMFGALRETEGGRKLDLHAIAVPDTGPYRKTLGPLEAFMARQGILLLWVHGTGEVFLGGATGRISKTLEFESGF
ncbi:hypothetical protein ACNPM2_03830 [Stenotrophomonas geniculata]|uniref:hypothetical protein n=1 Tax=Stenotrophomonas TaxID=40323 RepID=UPI001784266E|nr:hypothetical protein [Stenotrophomonas sp. AS012628]